MTSLFRVFFDFVYYLLSAQWWHDLMTFTCRKIKHSVLAYAHPLPCIIEVHVGCERSISVIMMQEMIECINDTCDVVFIPNSCEGNTVCIETNDETRVSGVMPAIRYLGRIGCMYPTTPESALQIDASLDRIGDLISETQKWDEKDKDTCQGIVVKHMQALEDEFHSRHVWIDGFDEKTVLDVCWTAIFRWIFENEVLSEMGEEYPNLVCWWRHIRPEYVLDESSEDESDGKTD